MTRRCIYCGTEKDLSKSDIIPDALTSAKIINPNVCRVAHNNKFSDMFENEVIEKLALITNELDVKSSKGNHYASYPASVIVDGTEYSTKMSTEAELFKQKIMRSIDGKSIIGPIDKIKNIKGASNGNVTEIDINQLEIEKKIVFDLSVFFGKSMYRLIAKIAFEWYCLNNSVTDKLSEFNPIINFITTGEGKNPVSIVRNEKIYHFFNQMMDMGSHTLISYVDEDASVNILVSLFGIAIYNVRLSDYVIHQCINNILFLTINVDAKRSYFRYSTLEEMEKEIKNSFYQMGEFNGLKIMCPQNFNDVTMTKKMMYYSCNFNKNELNCCNDMDDKLLALIRKQLDEVLNISALTVRGLKRFVKEHREAIDKGIVFNPFGTNKKAVFMFYLIFICGKTGKKIQSFEDLTSFVKNKFSGKQIAISDEICEEMKQEMEAVEEYAKIISQGAVIIENMKFD